MFTIVVVVTARYRRQLSTRPPGKANATYLKTILGFSASSKNRDVSLPSRF